MIFESPNKKQLKQNNSDDNMNEDVNTSSLQYTPTFKRGESSSVIKIYFNYKKAINTPDSEQTCKSIIMPSPCRTDIGKEYTNTASITKRLHLTSSMSKLNEVSLNHSSLKSKLLFIYNQYSKKNNKWIDSFEVFCSKENIDVNELKNNNPIKTYSEKQSFICSNEIFWLLSINYICLVKKFFSFEDLIALTHYALDSVKNSEYILNKCYLKLVKQFKIKERIKYCIKKRIPQLNADNYFKLLNDEKHMITKEDGTLIKTKDKQSKRVKLFNDISNVSINSHTDKNTITSLKNTVNPFVTDTNN